MSKTGKKQKRPETRKNMYSIGKKYVNRRKLMTVYETPNGNFVRVKGRLVRVHVGSFPADYTIDNTPY
jgi:hypothetical protein